MYTLKIYHDVKIEEEVETKELVVVQNIAESSFKFFTGHSYFALSDGGDKPIVRGFYPDNVYKDDSKRIELAEKFQEKNPNFNAYHVKEIKLNKEQYDRALEELSKYDKYLDKEKKQGILPKEAINGMWRLIGNNCSDFTNTIYRSTGLPGSFTYQYTTPELKQIPGVIEYYIDKFGVGDQEHIVSGGSIDDIASIYNVDKSLISEANVDNMPMDMDTKNMKDLGPKFYKIAANMELVGITKHKPEESYEYEQYLSNLKSMTSHPDLLAQIDEKSGMYSYEMWKKANDFSMKLAEERKEIKAKSIIESLLKSFREKFDAIRQKFKHKLENDVEKLAKEKTNEFQQKGQKEYDTKVQAIQSKKQQEVLEKKLQLESSLKVQYNSIVAQKQKEINSFIEQSQKDFDSKLDNLVKSKQGEYNAFVQKKQSEADMEFALRKQMAELNVNSPINSSTISTGVFVSNSDVVAQKNVEIENFKSAMQESINSEKNNLQSQINSKIQNHKLAKQAEIDKEIKTIEEQINKQLQSFISTKKTEEEKECNELKEAIVSKLNKEKSTSIDEVIKNAKNKEMSQVDKFNNKVTNITENQGLLSKVKEALEHSGDAEIYVKEELNLFLQGVAHDFNVEEFNL